MANNSRQERAEKKRQQRRARKALNAFLTDLRNACEKIDQIEQWLEHAKMLESIFHKYEDALPATARAQLHDAVKYANAVREGFDKACNVLKDKVEKVIPLLPGPIGLGTVLLAAFIVGAVAIGVASAVSAATAVTLTIANRNCGDIRIPPISIPGLELPQDMIRSGQQAEAKIPFWVTVNVDATSSPLVLRTFLLSFPIPGNPLSIKLADSRNPGGTELFIPGQSTPVNLAGKTNPQLVVACR